MTLSVHPADVRVTLRDGATPVSGALDIRPDLDDVFCSILGAALLLLSLLGGARERSRLGLLRLFSVARRWRVRQGFAPSRK